MKTTLGQRLWQIGRYAGPCLLVWGIYFLAFYPGMMSRDSLDQWREVTTFKFDDWHPAFDSDANNQGLKTRSVLPPVHTFLLKAYWFSHSVGLLRAIIYRPALYTYLSLLCVGLSCWLLRDRNYLLVLVPLLSIVGGIVLTVPAQHVRYLYPCFLLAPFFAGYFLLHLTQRRAQL